MRALRPTRVQLVWLAFAIILASVPVTLLAVVSRFGGHGEAHYYGGPIPVGVSNIDLIFGELRETTFFAPTFVLDVLITAVIFYVIGRRAGAIAALGAAVASVAALALGVFMVAKQFSDVGLPFPASAYERGPVPAATVLWVDMMIWAVGTAIVLHLLGRLVAVRMSRSSDLSRLR